MTIAIAHIDDPVVDEADALHKITQVARNHGHAIRDNYFDTAQDLYTIELPLGEGIFAGRFLDLTD
ncbi:MAG: hypothetical protein QNJ81_02180 [Acidimicrobiia bacterium]|nr:hypothetical protein [Acidimicrobiia bacterium]